MYANAALTPRHRLKVAQLVVDDGWADQRRRRPLPGLLAHREALGRPVHARPVLTTTPQPKNVPCIQLNRVECTALGTPYGSTGGSLLDWSFSLILP